MELSKKLPIIIMVAIVLTAVGVGIGGVYVGAKVVAEDKVQPQQEGIADLKIAQNNETKMTSDEANDMFAGYMSRLQKKIKSNWYPPNTSSSKRVVLMFKVNREGKIESHKVLQSSDDKTIDDAAIEALLKSEPFEPLPAGFKGRTVDVQFTFDYNVHKNKKPDTKVIVPSIKDSKYKNYFKNVQNKVNSKYKSNLEQGKYVIIAAHISQEGNIIGAVHYNRSKVDDTAEYNALKQAAPFGVLPVKIPVEAIEIYLKFDKKGCKLIESAELKDLMAN